MAARPMESQAFSVPAVLGATIAALRANFASLFAFTVVLVGIPQFFKNLLFAGRTVTQLAAYGGVIFLFGLLALALGALQQAALVHRVAAWEQHRSMGWREMLWNARPLIFPVAVLMLVYAVCVAAGCVLLVVPGLFIAVVWSVAVPAATLEGLGVGASLQRSWKLTVGHRWAVLGVLVVVGLCIAVVLSLSFLLARADAGGVLTAAIDALAQSLAACVTITALTCIYTQLNRASV